MKSTKNLKRTKKVKKVRGFTLIEILIVVIILGILAAIVIPQFTNASTEAKQSSLASQIQTLRSQIGLYKLQHGDKVPAAADLWTNMDEQTDAGGTAYTSGTSTSGPFGPYFDSPVTNPLMASSVNTVVGSTHTPDGTASWEYNPNTGEIHGVAPNAAGTGYILTDDGVNPVTFSVSPD